MIAQHRFYNCPPRVGTASECLARDYRKQAQSENAKVAELVEALDLGSSTARCESSSLSFRTKL